jgi:chromosome segregation ATPase
MAWPDILEYATKLAPFAAMAMSGGITLLILRLRQVFTTKTDLAAHAARVEELRREHETWVRLHDSEHRELSERLSRGEARFQRVEDRIDALPTRKDLEELTRTVAGMAAAMAAVQAELTGLGGSVTWVKDSLGTLLEHELAEARDAGKGGRG